MIEYIELSCVPCAESCSQVGSPNYQKLSRLECQVYKNQLERLFGLSAYSSVSLRIKSFPHDFGSYREVCVFYDDSNEMAQDLAYHIESNLPEYWDTEAKQMLNNFHNERA
jgi:hypothetical protein